MFEEITIGGSRVDPATGVAVGLMKMRMAHKPKLRIILRQNVMDAMGWSTGERVVPLIGREDSHGIIRLKKDQTKPGACEIVSKTIRGTWYETTFGYRPEFVDRAEKSQHCQWEKIDLVTLEIILPAWAMETKPKAKVVAGLATPPAVAAGKREEERLKAELEEADRRRADRAKVSEYEAKHDMLMRMERGMEVASTIDPALGLTKSERKLLGVLMRYPGRIVSRDVIMTVLYDERPDDAPQEKIIDVWVCRMRPKVETRGVEILTHWGAGWELKGDPAALARREAA